MKNVLTQKRIWIPAVGVIVLAGAIGLVSLVHEAYTGPLHCQSCHIDETVQWQASGSHSTETQCTDCHAPWPHGVPARINVLKQYRDEIMPIDMTAHHGRISDNCQHCHEEVLQAEYITSEIVVMSHRVHLEEGLLCVDCHRNVSHDTMTGQTYRPTKGVCYECHLRDIDVSSPRDQSCLNCHRIILSRESGRQ